ncbi:hypothetical protein [Vibrio sp. SCSIO 43136]|uniref:hypothetical protein n=1 Tax=Vibrio sp. SCSIO 43136 TaxID=2819101 RepID=UPI0020762964|nr:hypothetical protein [Vibrio sp. SCSIO 43136]USD66106.1 hypothetical protein J4N39_04605 [Vibrio sp. SCSIO 43136]
MSQIGQIFLLPSESDRFSYDARSVSGDVLFIFNLIYQSSHIPHQASDSVFVVCRTLAP